jgi:arsenical pump membrane protein
VAVFGNAIGSNIVNNVPMTLLTRPLIERATEPGREALAYGTLIGANIGPTLTTYGSLATMLWLALIRKRGLDVSTTEYLRVAIVTTPVVLIAATLSLWVTLR